MTDGYGSGDDSPGEEFVNSDGRVLSLGQMARTCWKEGISLESVEEGFEFDG